MLLAATAAVAQAATTDTATIRNTTPIVHPGDTIHLEAGQCTVACSLTWKRPDLGLARFGGQQIGTGPTLNYPAPTTTGSYVISLTVNERCVGSPRTACSSIAYTVITVTN